MSVELPGQYNFAMNVYAKMRGKTGLKVTVRVTDPLAKQFYGQAHEFSDEIQIQVCFIVNTVILSTTSVARFTIIHHYIDCIFMFFI